MQSTKVIPLRSKIIDYLIEAVMLLVSLLFLYPVYYMLEASVKPPKDFYVVLKFPSELYWGNYIRVFEKVHVLQAFGNTLVICAATLTLLIVVASMAGYSISRTRHKAFGLLFIFFISGLIIPFQTSMILIYKLAMVLGLMNTRTLMVLLYTAQTIPLAVLIYVGFTKSIPRELDEAAYMDGCGKLRLFWSIIFPLLAPATGTLVVTTIFHFWNDFIGPLLYLKDPSKLTLITQIYVFKTERSSEWGPIFALCAITTLPMVVLFLFIQKHLIKGLTAGAIKG